MNLLGTYSNYSLAIKFLIQHIANKDAYFCVIRVFNALIKVILLEYSFYFHHGTFKETFG